MFSYRAALNTQVGIPVNERRNTNTGLMLLAQH